MIKGLLNFKSVIKFKAYGYLEKFKNVIDSNSFNGSITVEAAIILPIFICAVMTIGMFSRIYYVNEIMHHALTETANELSNISYVYHASGIYGIQKDLDDKLGDYSDVDLDSINKIEDVAYFVGAHVYDEGKVHFGNMIVKELSKKYLIYPNNNDVDARLKRLNIVGGWEGLDFSRSSYLTNNQDIDIVVSYKVDLPLPFKFIKEIPILQRVTLRAWMGGSLPTDFAKSETTEDGLFPAGLVDEVVEAGYDIWSLPVFKRGREIKGILGSDLDVDFPIIDQLENRQVIAIRTHDTRLASNQGRRFYYQLTADIRELEDFKERSYRGTSVGPEDYDGKVLNIVIPYVELSEEQIKYIGDAKKYAADRNITIKITVVK